MAEPGVETRTRSSVITARAAASFDPVGRSVATARAFVRDTLQGWGHADVVDDAVVLTSELVTNAVIHAGTSADVLCLRKEDGVRVEVSDRYPEREIPMQGTGLSLGSPDRENGRGLLLCAALASRWGVDYTPTHKRVWFQLDLPDRPVGARSAARSCRTRSSPSPTNTSGSPSSRSTGPEPSRPGTRTRGISSATPPTRSSANPSPTSPPGRTPRASARASSRRCCCPAGRAVTESGTATAGSFPCTPPISGCATPRANRPRSAFSYATTSAPSSRPRSAPPSPRRATRTAPWTPSRSSSAHRPRRTWTDCSSAPSNAPATCSKAIRPSCCSPPTTRRSWRYAPRRASRRPGSASPASRWRPARGGTARPGCPPSTRTWPSSPARSRSSTAPACAPWSRCRSRSRAAHRFARCRRGVPGPLFQRGGAAPPVRRRPHRTGRGVGPPR